MEGVPLAQTTERDGVKDWKANGMDTSAAEKQEGGMEWEYTKDGSVDLFGRPADRKRLGGTRTLPFSLGIQFLTTVAYYGVATNLVLYLTQKLYQDTSKATTNVTNWDGATLLFSAIGAFFADSYLGRYWASVLFVLFYFIGLLLATLTTILPSLKPVPCTPTLSSPCLPLTGKRIWVFYLALYIQSLGFGGYQPCNIAFGADQFDEQHEREKKQKSMYFSLTYAASNAAGLIGNTFLIYLESKDSYTWGYAISTGLVGLGLLGYLSAVFISRYQKPQGNPLTRITQVLVAAARNWQVQPPSDPDDLYELYTKSGRRLVHTNQFEFLDRAAIKTEKHVAESSRSPWKLCTITQVEEAKFIARILPIWASSVFYTTLYVQILTLYIEQASTLDTRLGTFNIPAASVGVFENISVVFWAVTYEKVVVPVARRWTGHPRGFTLLQRMGTGLIIIIIATVIAAMVEILRLSVVKHHGLERDATAVVPMSVFWLFPQYFFVGASEIFMFVGQYEFFYDQAPDDIRGIGSCLSLVGSSLGNFLSSFLVTVVTQITRHGSNPGWISNNLNNGHIDYFYWLLVILSIIDLAIYIICAMWYKYTDVVYIDNSGDEADCIDQYSS